MLLGARALALEPGSDRRAIGEEERASVKQRGRKLTYTFRTPSTESMEVLAA